MKLTRKQWISGLRAIDNDTLAGLLIEAKHEDAIELGALLLQIASVRSGKKLSELLQGDLDLIDTGKAWFRDLLKS
jgi:hypothetical protein